MSRRTKAILSLVAAAACWAGNYIFGQVAVAGMSPFSIVLLRWAIALIPIAAIAQIVEHPDWNAVLRHWPFLLMQGALGLLAYNMLLYTALQVSTAFAASLINAANPALIALVSFAVLRERIGWQGGAGIAVALLGVLIVLTHGDVLALKAISFGSGDLLMLGAIAVWAVYTVAARMGPKLPPVSAVTIQVAFIVIGLGVAAPFIGVTLSHNGPTLASLLFSAIFPSCLSYVLWNTALIVIPPGQAGVYLNLITLFTAFWAIATGESITASQIIGGLTIIAGVLITSVHGRNRIDSHSPRAVTSTTHTPSGRV